jgi:Tfp pilus assembly protein FimT
MMNVYPRFGTNIGISRQCRSSQQGMTLLSFLVTVAIAIVLGTLVLRLLPAYVNHYKVKSSLEALQSQPQWASQSREEIINSLQKHWEVDTVDDVTPRDIVITRAGRNTKVRIAYDVTRPFFRNIDLVIHFDEAIEAAER